MGPRATGTAPTCGKSNTISGIRVRVCRFWRSRQDLATSSQRWFNRSTLVDRSSDLRPTAWRSMQEGVLESRPGDYLLA